MSYLGTYAADRQPKLMRFLNATAVRGLALFDDRESSPTRGKVNQFNLNPMRPTLIRSSSSSTPGATPTCAG